MSNKITYVLWFTGVLSFAAGVCVTGTAYEWQRPTLRVTGATCVAQPKPVPATMQSLVCTHRQLTRLGVVCL